MGHVDLGKHPTTRYEMLFIAMFVKARDTLVTDLYSYRVR